MRSSSRSLRLDMRIKALAVGVLLCLPVVAAAQGSRVIITVYQTARTGETIRAYAAVVCFTSTNYSKYTDAYGTVTFDNVPQGAWSAVAWKSGFAAKRADISVLGTGTDVRATITLAEASFAASPCALPATPLPMPPAQPGKVTLVITVFRVVGSTPTNVTPLPNAYVCVGADSSHPDSYAKRAYTDANGKVVFHVDPLEHWQVTAGKSGFVGATAYYILPNPATYGIVQFRLFEGSGGPTCPVPIIPRF
jgi:hypothetical protein